MNQQEMIDLCIKHTLYTWSATGSVQPIPVARAEGVYFFGPDGKKWLDFNSQLMSVNIGHSHPKVIEAIKAQADTLLFAYPGTATEIRAKLAARLAEIMPGDLNTVFFTLAGADANENAIRFAKIYTGKQKILTRYRSYHGSTNACMQLTGDPRRIPNEPGLPGVVHVMDPWPYSFSWGETEAEITAKNLAYLEEVIQYEGAGSIAAMMIETITGTNGVLPPPEGYLRGLRDLLDRYGILLICDEVMAGFGRSGKLFAFMHDGIVPDIVTMAKGLTSSYLPLGAVAMRDSIADYFRDHVFPGGLTYNSHPMGLAAALAAVNVLIEEGMIENAAKMESVMLEHMAQLKAKHPSMKAGRCKGLFGMIDLQKDAEGTPAAAYNEGSESMTKLGAFLKENGLFTFVRWGSFMCNPPLCINEAQIAEAFEIIDRGLKITDEAMA